MSGCDLRIPEKEMIRLIASDLDGSLLDDRKKLPSDFHDVFARMKANGIQFASASGRDLNGASQYFPEYKDDMYFITDNGANIYHGEENLLCRTFDKELADAIIEYAGAHSLNTLVCAKTGSYIDANNRYFVERMQRHYSVCTPVDDLRTVDDIFKISFFYSEGDIVKDVYEGLNAEFGERANVAVSGRIWMDIIDLSADKGVALRWLQKHLGVDRSETMVFGDYYNDIPLLNNADFAFVMENANEDLKSQYRYTAPNNNEDGVTRAIIDYALIEYE